MKLFSIVHDKNNGMSIYPCTNGLFVAHENKDDFLNFLKDVFFATFQILFEKDLNENRFLIRASISYGPIFIGKNIIRSYPFQDDIVIGNAVSQAFSGIHNAPPYGIYVDETARAFTQDDVRIQSVYYKWFSSGEYFGKNVIQYLKWCKLHSNSILYKPIDIERHILLASEYFSTVKLDAN